MFAAVWGEAPRAGDWVFTSSCNLTLGFQQVLQRLHRAPRVLAWNLWNLGGYIVGTHILGCMQK